MKVQHEHEIISSFLLFLDHELCSRGKAYVNHSSTFYPVRDSYQNYYTYGAPFQQLVYDDSIGLVQGNRSRKPTVMSGVYLGNQYIQPGESGLAAIDYEKGQLHFSLDYPDAAGLLPSGSYAVKDFNLYLTNEPENRLLFETKFKLNPKVNQNPTGLPPDVQVYPAIYIRNLTSTNEPVSLHSEIYDTEIYVRAIVLSDSAYSLDACCALLSDTNKRRVARLSAEEQPFGPLGYFGGSSFKYKDSISGKFEEEDSSFFVEDVIVSKKSQNKGDFDNLNSDVFVGFVDFTLKNMRNL